VIRGDERPPVLALTLMLFTAGDGPPLEPVVLTRDFAALSEGQALSLHGGRHRFRLVRDSDPDELGGCVSFDCAGADDLHRTVRFRKGVAVDPDAEAFVVEATVRVLYHGGWGPFEGFAEVRLVDAVGVE
jgi:hypothetical protein